MLRVRLVFGDSSKQRDHDHPMGSPVYPELDCTEVGDRRLRGIGETAP